MMRTLLLFLIISIGAFGQTNIQVTDLLKIKTLGRPIFSPDGQKYLFTVTSIVDDPDVKGDFVYQTHLYVGDLKSNTSRAMTAGKHSIGGANWAPDGQSILFTRDMGNKSQVYQLSLAGGEPLALTNSRSPVQNPSISKFDSRLFYQTSTSLKDLYSFELSNPKHLIPSWTLEKPNISNQEFVSK
ncbi:MAG: hypothetical protein AABZ56_04220, partial [Bacteroidota bacterium]